MSQKRLLILNISICLIFVIAVSLAAVFLRSSETSREPVAPVDEDEVIEDDSWAFFLINEQNPLPADYEPELSRITGDFYLDARCAIYAVQMLEAAAREGVVLHVVSAYRSLQRQADNFDNYVERLMSEGMSEIEAVTFTASQIAAPGASEHNAGLALDILSEDWFVYNNDITEDFEKTPEFRWLAVNSWKHGFILRYPKGTEDITGISYEPWHFRYVGIDIAEQIYNSGLTLEEYTELYGNTD
ncbi:MAG: M15 family metallopeptidase [Oscillospiraceae bacterium]|nr:M15 family metallopeptidase [Oscillospiraceae bacterium]